MAVEYLVNNDIIINLSIILFITTFVFYAFLFFTGLLYSPKRNKLFNKIENNIIKVSYGILIFLFILILPAFAIILILSIGTIGIVSLFFLLLFNISGIILTIRRIKDLMYLKKKEDIIKNEVLTDIENVRSSHNDHEPEDF
jgi:hypothetical protein